MNDTRPAVSADTAQIRSLPRLMAGGGWETTIVLMDVGPTPVAFRQSFFGSDGIPASFAVRQQASNTSLTTSGLQGIVPPNGSVSYVLQDDGGPLREAWSLVSFDGNPNLVSGYATLRHHVASGFNFEVTLPLNDMQDSSARMPFDNTGGFQTQLTLVNPASNLAEQVQLTYLNAQGQVILMDSVTLAPGAQTTIVLPNTYPDLGNQTGTIAIFGSTNYLSAAGIRVNSSSAAMTTIPVIDYNPSINVQ